MARYDIKAWRESRNGKAYTVRVGSAWQDQKGVMRLDFDALPVPDKDGRISCFLEEARAPGAARDDRQPHPAKGIAEGRRAELDDDIPFAPEVR